MPNDPSGRDELIVQIQSGNQALREQFLRDYQGFVAATVSSVMGGRSINREKDPVFNTGLLALNEALDSYNPGKGASFINFARQVITRRVIDTLRQHEREARLTVVTPLDEVSHPAMSIAAATEKIEVQEELKTFAGQLNKFGLTMSDLVKQSPRHRDSKKLAIKIGRTLAEDPELIKHL
ncbi:MAG: sigma factor, partial [Desulfotomaculaceae bacterium]